MKKRAITAILFSILFSGGFFTAMASEFGDRVALNLCGGNGANWVDPKTYTLLPGDSALWEGAHSGTGSSGRVLDEPVVFTFIKVAGATEAKCTRKQATWNVPLYGHACSEARVTKVNNVLNRPGYGDVQNCP